MSRVTTAYVSAYQRDRVHHSRFYRFEKRTLTANFTAAIPDGEAIDSVTWYCNGTSVAIMADAIATTKTSSITLAANASGKALIKCEATLTDGQVINQLFAITSLPAPYFCGETLTASV